MKIKLAFKVEYKLLTMLEDKLIRIKCLTWLPNPMWTCAKLIFNLLELTKKKRICSGRQEWFKLNRGFL